MAIKAGVDLAFDACENRRLEDLQTVVPQIVDSNTRIPLWNKNGIKIENPTLLHIAAFSGAYECAKFLLKYGAEVSALDHIFL